MIALYMVVNIFPIKYTKGKKHKQMPCNTGLQAEFPFDVSEYFVFVSIPLKY
jgi:hypothetical protein